MSEIDFLGNKKDDDQKPRSGDDKDDKNKVIWSEPSKEPAASKSGLASFFPLLSRKPWVPAPAKPAAADAVDKSKIKESRQEILKLIKHHESLAAEENRAKTPGKSFLNGLGEKFAKPKGRQEILIDYQKVFNQEKNKRSLPIGQAGLPAQALNIKPAAEKKETVEPIKAAGAGWLTGLLKLIGQKISALKLLKTKPAPPVTLRPGAVAGFGAEKINQAIRPKPPAPETAKEELRPAPAVEAGPEIKIEAKSVEVEKEPAQKRQARPPVLETNLIRGEIITYFDWRRKIIVTVIAVLAPVFLTGAIYAGVSFYQKADLADSREQVKKLNELTETIKREEIGLKEISDFQARLKLTSQIFARHIYWTNFFKFLEDNTIKNVYYTGFSGDTGGNYSLDAFTTSYGNISEQAKAFKNNREVIDVLANGGELAPEDENKKTKIKFIFKFSILRSLFTR